MIARVCSLRRRGSASAVALLLSAALLAWLAGGCSESTGPQDSGGEPEGAALVDGSLAPGEQTFVLRTLDDPVPGTEPIPVDLIGSNLQIDAAAEVVALDVAIHNGGARPLYAPAMVWLTSLFPETVEILNADVVVEPPDPATGITRPARWGFDYTALLGGDNSLGPDETSTAKTWRFHVPGLTAFSFRARPQFGMVPELPRIAGLCFHDQNRNGRFDAGETPASYGRVSVTAPDGATLFAIVGEEGRYATPISQTGLYRLHFNPMIRCRCLVDYTTPNPLSVLLPPGPDGRPNSFLDANFGFVVQADDDTVPPVLRSLVPLDSLGGDFYHFVEGTLEGDVLRLRVGFSGCQPNHPFALYWVPGPEMTPFTTVWLALVHDDLGEMCQAAWMREPRFDLSPIREEYGGLPIVLRFRDFGGQLHTFVYGEPPPD